MATPAPASTSATTCWRSRPDRKSTRLNSSHVSISYADFCLKKKNVLPQALDRMLPMSLLLLELRPGHIRLHPCDFPSPAGQLLAHACRSVPSPRLRPRLYS